MQYYLEFIFIVDYTSSFAASWMKNRTYLHQIKQEVIEALVSAE